MNALLRNSTTVMPLQNVSMFLVDLNVNVEKATKIHGRIINIEREDIVNSVLLSTVTIEENASIRMAKKSACKYP